LVFQFEVEDTGPGIPGHLQQRVFEPFVQGDLRLNRKYGGTRLSLSICSQLSKLMGGNILLESEQGKGTLFSVRLPLGFVKESAPSTTTSSIAGSRTSSVFSLDELATVARAPSNNSIAATHDSTTNLSEKQDTQPRLVGLSQPFFAPPVHPTNNEEPRKIRALVAEDNVVNQEVVLRMLALEEVYDVAVVKDGQEAYDTVKANMEEGKVFDLIFMDIQVRSSSHT
jgi:osomolarity two-component system sensor histidine kinase SLN1